MTAYRAALWRAENDAVDRFFAALPGFEAHADVLQPLIDAIQAEAMESRWRPPRTERSRDSHLAALVVVLAGESIPTDPPEAGDVLMRALKRIGLASYWQDPLEQPQPGDAEVP